MCRERNFSLATCRDRDDIGVVSRDGRIEGVLREDEAMPQPLTNCALLVLVKHGAESRTVRIRLILLRRGDDRHGDEFTQEIGTIQRKCLYCEDSRRCILTVGKEV